MSSFAVLKSWVSSPQRESTIWKGRDNDRETDKKNQKTAIFIRSMCKISKLANR